MNYLVTGGAGFIGSNLVHLLGTSSNPIFSGLSRQKSHRPETATN